MKMRPSNRASRVEMPGNRLPDRVPSDEYPPTCAADLAVFGHCHPTLAAFSRTDWLTNNPRSAEDDQGTRQLQANAQAALARHQGQSQRRSHATPIDSSPAYRHPVSASDVGRISVTDAHQHLAPLGVNRISVVSCAIL